MNDPNSYSKYSDFNPETARQIQGLADLLSNLLITEDTEETEISLSWKNNNQQQKSQLKSIDTEVINSKSEIPKIIEEKDRHLKDVVTTANSQESPPTYAPISLFGHSKQTLEESPKNSVLVPKPEPKFKARNQLLEIEVEGGSNILVGLESRIYNHQELINLLLPAVTETIRDKINEREGAIANLFKPGEGKTITEQIEHETELLMDALYPVIGATMGDYIAATIGKINSKVADALDGAETGNHNLKIKVISQAKLNEQKSTYFKVKAVFLIQKKSHLIISEKQNLNDNMLTKEYLASMLTTIRNLSYKFNSNSSQILVMEYGDNKINIYGGKISYLAAISEGNPTPKFFKECADTLNQIEQQYETSIKLFQGDLTTIPEELGKPLQKILDFEVNSEIKQRNRLLIGGSLALLFLVGIPYGVYRYFNYKEQVVEQGVMEKLAADSELGFYNLEVDIKDKHLNLFGNLPNEYLREKAADIAKNEEHNFPLNNQIKIVDLPPNQGEIKAEIAQLLKAFNQIEGIEINANLQGDTLTLTGEALPVTDLNKITQTFAEIKGIKIIDNQINLQPLQIPSRIYFGRNSAQVSPRDIQNKLIPIKEQMQTYPQLKLKIIGYRSPSERWNIGKQRSQAVENALEDLGVDRRRLETEAHQTPPPDVQDNQEQWLSQAVIFETFR